MQGAQVEEDVDQRVLVGNGLPVAQFGALDAQFDGLAVDAFVRRALLVDLLVSFSLAVELVADASANAGGDGGGAADLGPAFVVDGAMLTRLFGEEQGADVAPAWVVDEGCFGPEGVPERHRQPGFAQGRAVFVKGELVAAAFGEGDGGEAAVQVVLAIAVEVGIDVEGIERGVESTKLRVKAQAALDVGHQGEEVGDVGLVEGLG